MLVSGLTVMASLAGMFLMGDAEGGGMAVGSIVVVGVAVLGSLTVLPAVLAKLGDRVHRSRLPVLRRMKREERDSRIWGFVLGHVLRRPVVALVGRPRRARRPRRPGDRHAHEGHRHGGHPARCLPGA